MEIRDELAEIEIEARVSLCVYLQRGPGLLSDVGFMAIHPFLQTLLVEPAHSIHVPDFTFLESRRLMPL